jgi:phosphopantothenoylcysteine decarboxylase/phosphopantothenate--cysteine ligase
MNTKMWNHPATQRNLRQLREDGVRIIDPDAGEMACGTIGPGRLSEPERIVSVAVEVLLSNSGRDAVDLKGERVLITAGATREDIDPVRFLSNRSSGRMGFALAEAARSRGAFVKVVAGDTSAYAPSGVQITRALSAEQMCAVVMKELDDATIFIGAAAVADYRPTKKAEGKLKKSDATFVLSLEPTPDIVAQVVKARHNGLLVVGFAAETDDLIENARHKLASKQLDIIAANDVTSEGAGFDVDTNIITLLTRDNTEPVALPLMSKLEVAHRILDEVLRLRQSNSKT